jgi:hypothetical protein
LTQIILVVVFSIYPLLIEVPPVKRCRLYSLMAKLGISQHREDLMHAVVRSYSGSGAKELFDLLEQRLAEVESLIRGVQGFVAYSLIRTSDGGVTVTVCQNQAGTDESIQLARDWIQQNASDLNTSPPVVAEGSALLHLS